jgi:hypothetical protein
VECGEPHRYSVDGVRRRKSEGGTDDGSDEGTGEHGGENEYESSYDYSHPISRVDDPRGVAMPPEEADRSVELG